MPLVSMADFNNCIYHCGLVDLLGMGQHMSWCNGHEEASRSWAKLDRALINTSFSELFGLAHFKYLSRKSSDHCPMVVYVNRHFLRYGPAPFCFQNMWCSHDNFLLCVKDAWCNLGWGLSKLAVRLKRTKIALRAWNINVFGRVDAHIQALAERLDILDNNLQSCYSVEEEDDFLATKLELQVWEKREASRLGQLTKKKWLVEGDQNSKFFLQLSTREVEGGA
ncbi:hypothetical protein I3760_09G103900 [Carya illinoinensis]|nr:hypothetical protein I3760_09G103900 [Carya illinoinensis]